MAGWRGGGGARGGEGVARTCERVRAGAVPPCARAQATQLDSPAPRRGLDQSVALPGDSYLQQYYADVLSALRVGPPVMLVVRGLNVSGARVQATLGVCRAGVCLDPRRSLCVGKG